MAITQFVAEQGWLGISFDSVTATQQPTRTQNKTTCNPSMRENTARILRMIR